MFLVSDSILKTIAKIVLFSLVDMTLLQSLFGMTTFSHSLNGVCWFLSTLFICYLFCPRFLKVVDKLNTKLKIRIFYLLTIVILMISSYLGNHIDGLKLINGRIDDLAYGHPFFRCWYLLLGMIVGKCYQRKQQVNGCYVFTTTLLAIIWFLNRNTFINIGRVLRVIDVMICTLVLYVFSIGSGKIIEFLSKDKMVWLGEISEFCSYFIIQLE